MSELLYADAGSPPEGARFAIVGAPFEKTTCHRKGCAGGPRAIREESYNFETYIPGADLDLGNLAITDLGDIPGDDFREFARAAGETARDVRESGAFPILLGGEHAVTPLWLAALSMKDPWNLAGAGAKVPDGPPAWGEDLCAVVVDAHMDFRDGYLGEHLSHASASRRMADVLGPASVIPFGIRSFCSEEREDAARLGLGFVTADEVRERGAAACARGALAKVPSERRHRTYLSVDIDGIDPAYAPGVGTPEPFGMTPLDVRELIRELAPGLAGFDVVEVCPPADNGNTAALAARLVSEVVGCVARAGGF